MKILQIGKYYPPENGGIETVTADLAEGFAGRGWESEVVVFTRKSPEDLVVNGVRVIRRRCAAILASQPFGLKWMIEAIRRARSADVTVIHTPNILGGLISPFLGRTRFVVYWHSDIVNKGLLGWLVRPLEALMMRRADQLWVTSEVYADSSSSVRRYADKVRMMPIGIRDAASGPREPLSDEIARFLRGRRFALSVGRLVPYKGFSDLVRAAVRLAPEHAIIVAGGGALAPQLAEEVKRAGVEDRVLLAGRVPDELLRALFAHADLFVMSSNQRSEAYGVVLLEAMAFGLPIVATDIAGSGVPWVAGGGALGHMVPVGAPEALADAIRDILEKPDVSELRAASRERYCELFHVDDMVERAVSLVR